MDLVTQGALGAALGELVLGRRLGWRAAAIGAGLGWLPDVDALLAPLLSDLQVLTWHRSLTHSLVFCALAPPLLGLLLQRFHADTSRRAWVLLAYLVVATHVLIDCCTTFGTQVGWPFSTYPLTFRLVSIIDPCVTAPLLIGLGVALRLDRERRARTVAAALGLGAATAYLLLLLGVKLHVDSTLAHTLAARNVTPRRALSKPTMGNGVLWRVVAEDEQGFWVGYYSLLDSEAVVEHVRTVPRHAERLGALADDPGVIRLLEVLDHYYAVEADAEGLLVHDLRYGQWMAWASAPSPWVFSYRLTPTPAGVEVRVLPRIRPGRELGRSFMARIGGR
jgi:inner membrane protein